MKETLKKDAVDRLIENYADENCPDESIDNAFALYAVEQLLKPRTYSNDVLRSGIVDGSMDGGIDAVYAFLNGVPLFEDSPQLDPNSVEVQELAKKPLLEIVIVQSKNTNSWEEIVWTKMMAALPVLLDPETKDEDLQERYSNSLIVRTGIVRKIQQSLSTKFPRISVKIAYATRAIEQNITAANEALRSDLETLLSKDLFHGSELIVKHMGASSLYELSSQASERTGTIEFSELIRTDEAYLGLVSLSKYLEFLKNDEGLLEEDLFEANVRDYEGDKKNVNQSILSTLSQEDATNFWWRNNGITILATEVDCPSKKMTLESPLIVNGLQTSHVLYNASKNNNLDPSRAENMVCVKVIVSNDDNIRDAVIEGTNRQISIPVEALFASEGLQADIERYFFTQGWYYERRRNYYKNKKMPSSKRISVLYLAQAVMALALGEPNTARARPTTLLSKENGYNRVFSSNIDCDGYLAAARIMSEVDSFLQLPDTKAKLTDKTNTRYYIALCYYMLKLGIKDISNLHFAENAHRIKFPLDTDLLNQSADIVILSQQEAQMNDPQTSIDTLAKRVEFRDLVLSKLN